MVELCDADAVTHLELVDDTVRNGETDIVPEIDEVGHADVLPDPETLSELLSDSVFDVVGVTDNEEQSVADAPTVDEMVPEVDMECVADAVRQTDADEDTVVVWRIDTDGDVV